MTCDQRRDPILLYAADALEPAEREEIRAHLASGCPRCAGTLAEAEAMLARLPLALPPLAPPPQLRDRLLELAREDSAQRTSRVPLPTSPAAKGEPRPRGRLARRLLATAACAALIVSALWAVQQTRQNKQLASRHAELRDQYAAASAKLIAAEDALTRAQQQAAQARADAEQATQQLAQARQRVAQAQTQLAEALRAAEVLGAENVQLVSLAGNAPAAPGAKGRILWDQDAGQWHVRVFDLKPPGPGRTYQLWFITGDEKKVPAGTFQVNAAGAGSLVVDVPKEIGPIAVAAVTDEPAGGSQQPTGSIHLAGKIR